MNLAGQSKIGLAGDRHTGPERALVALAGIGLGSGHGDRAEGAVLVQTHIRNDAVDGRSALTTEFSMRSRHKMPLCRGTRRQKFGKLRSGLARPNEAASWPACALASARALRKARADAPLSGRQRHWPRGGSARKPLHHWPATARERQAGDGSVGNLLQVVQCT